MLALALLGALAATPAPSPAATPPQRTYVGVYLRDVSGFDLKEGRFKADLQLWCKWAGAPEPPAIELVNGEIESREEVARESDGDWHSVRWRVQATFRGTFPLHRFPFDTQELSIEISAPPSAGELVPDLAGSGMSERFSITGWIYEPWFHAETHKSTIASDLGAVASEGSAHHSETIAFGVELQRPFIAYVAKFVLPLSVILAMGVLAVLLPGDRIDVRSGIGVTVLLACVAFHFSQAGALPEVPYLVLADKLFLGAYALIFLTFAASISSYLLYDTRRALTRKVDLATFVGVPLIGAAFVLIEARREPPALEAARLSSALPTATATPAPPSREVLRIGALSSSGVVSGVTRRGLSRRLPDGTRAGHLVDVVPSMTNDRVRLLPDGGMRVRWRLRHGMKWSDGTPITSEDLHFSVTTLDNADRLSAEKVDARTLDIRYRSRLSDHLLPFNVVPKHVMEAGFETREKMFKRTWTEAVPGDGPYRSTSVVPEESATFERNPYFAGPAPLFARIEVREYEDSVSLAEALRSGAIDFAPAVSLNGIEKLRDDASIVLRQQLGEVVVFLQPDFAVKPLDDVNVRRAIAMAVDRDAVARILYGDQGIPASNYRPPSAADAATDIAPIPFDPAGARKRLLAAGVKLPLKLKFVHGEVKEGTPGGNALARLRADFPKAGIVLESAPLKSTQDAFRSAAHGGLLYYSRSTDELIAPYWGLPYAGGGYRTERLNVAFDASVQAELARYDATLFDERRESISRSLQRKFAERAPLIPIAFGSRTSAAHASLEGPMIPGEASVYWNVEEWTIPAVATSTSAKPATATTAGSP